MIGTRVIDSTPAQTNTSPASMLDRARRHVDRLHRRAAEAVDRRGGDALRQAGEKADQAGDVQPLLALGEGAADDQVLDRLRVDAGALDQRGDHLRRQIVGPDAGEAPLCAGWNGERA